jgi:hypothetical protein
MRRRQATDEEVRLLQTAINIAQEGCLDITADNAFERLQ